MNKFKKLLYRRGFELIDDLNGELPVKSTVHSAGKEMLNHLNDYGVKVEPYVKEKFPTGFESYELFEVLAEYFTHTA